MAAPKNMIGLGKKPETSAVLEKSSPAKEYYPSLHVSDVKELDSLPKGKFYFIGCGKVVASSTSERGGKSTSSHEIEVSEIKPISKDQYAEEGEDEKEGLDGALNKVADAKSKAADDEEDSQDSGADEEAEGEPADDSEEE